MKKKVTKFVVEIIMNELTDAGFLDDVLDDDDEVYSFNVIKENTITIDDDEEDED